MMNNYIFIDIQLKVQQSLVYERKKIIKLKAKNYFSG